MVIEGSIDEIRFRNDENGFSIVVLDCAGEPVVCAGSFPPIAEGQNLRLTGDFTVHPKFGKQFKVSCAESAQPDTLDGIVRYLGSGLIRGVGPKTALAIVETFGDKTLDIIRYNPERLSAVRGISKPKAIEIAAEYDKIQQLQDAMIFLQSYGISLNLSLKIYREYGDKTQAKVKSNPYRLIEDIDGVGFITADKIAAKLGITGDSEFRLRAGVLYTLRDSGEKNGNTFLPREELKASAAALLGCDAELLEDVLDNLIIQRKLREVSAGGHDGVMLTSTYRIEKGAAVSLLKLVREADRLPRDFDEDIAEFERREGIKFHEMQKQAIKTAASSGVTVLTGGPGTGKTTIIKCILFILDGMRNKYALMAPTGRAAKRLGESCGQEASTVHRALMITPGAPSSSEPLGVNTVIVDEFSMVDIFLFHTLLARLSEGTRLILVGDSDQLPSVGAGNVLKDVMESDIVPCVRLTQIYRQAEQSLITVNAHRVNRGEMPYLTRTDGDFFFSHTRSQAETADVAVDMAAERVPKYLGIEPFRVQVLCPMKNGAAGSIALNKRLQERLNANSREQITAEDYVYRTGDKVMHITNNYSLEWKKQTAYSYESGEGVFNGDMGIITEIRTASGEMDVLYEDGRCVTYTADVRSQLIPAYAITVHKSQGSEFDAIILPVVLSGPLICTRNLLYTAITRAKRMVVIVGDEYAVRRMVENNYIQKRYSALRDFLAEGGKELDILYGGDE